MVCVTTVLLSALTLATRRHSRSTSALSSADCYSGDPRGLLRGQIQCFRLLFLFFKDHSTLISIICDSFCSVHDFYFCILRLATVAAVFPFVLLIAQFSVGKMKGR